MTQANLSSDGERRKSAVCKARTGLRIASRVKGFAPESESQGGCGRLQCDPT